LIILSLIHDSIEGILAGSNGNCGSLSSITPFYLKDILEFTANLRNVVVVELIQYSDDNSHQQAKLFKAGLSAIYGKFQRDIEAKLNETLKLYAAASGLAVTDFRNYSLTPQKAPPAIHSAILCTSLEFYQINYAITAAVKRIQNAIRMLEQNRKLV